jgi:hypothetical protein
MTGRGACASPCARMLGATISPGGVILVWSLMYEVTFAGRAGNTLRAAFEDCTVIVGPGTTTLRVRLPDRAALRGLVQRISDLGLELVDLHLVLPD